MSLTLVGTIAHHGVGLATACLPIGKQRAVVALPSIVQDSSTQVIKDLLLVCSQGGMVEEWWEIVKRQRRGMVQKVFIITNCIIVKI